jgi:hypothetical protein
MNIIVAETEIEDNVSLFIGEMKKRANKKLNLVSNPIQSYVYSFTKNNKQYSILGIEIKAIPIYYAFFALLLGLFLFPNLFFAITSIVFGLLSIPYSILFWIMLYRFGLKKYGYTGKVKFLTKNKALEVLLWGK